MDQPKKVLADFALKATDAVVGHLVNTKQVFLDDARIEESFRDSTALCGVDGDRLATGELVGVLIRRVLRCTGLAFVVRIERDVTKLFLDDTEVRWSTCMWRSKVFVLT